MRLMLCRFLAISSLLFTLAAQAATRPHYGGTLRLETHAKLASLDPSQMPAADAMARNSILPLISDTLVSLDSNARPVPRLATRWQSDNGNKRWQFWIRPGVFLHNGASLTPAHVARSLSASNPDWKVRGNSESITIESELPLHNLPVELARATYAIFAQAADEQPVGTGPFRVAEFQPGRRLLLRANDDYWDGRPYLDMVDITLGVPLREQAVHQQLGRADVVEAAQNAGRAGNDENRRVVASAPVELIAIVFPHGGGAEEDPRLRHALSLSIDRSAIQSTLLQRQGEPAASLLPQWVSGYAYLFQFQRDVIRARQLRAEVPAAASGIALSYDPGDSLARAIAERVSVNASDAGIAVTVSPITSASPASTRIVRVTLATSDPQSALAEIVAATDPAQSTRVLTAASIEDLYATERAILDEYRVVPIAALPQAFALAPRVRNWAEPREGGWPLENVWVDTAKERTTP